MKIGIGLPATIAETTGPTLIEWARRAEQLGFSSLGVLDRLAFPNFDPLIALGAAAAVTERISLCTAILLGPLQVNAAQFARQIASIEAISNGRMILGFGAGSRPDDFELAGVEFEKRGQLFDTVIETATSIWRGERGEIGPVMPRPGGPPLLFGGESAPALRRATRFGDGWIAGAGRVQGYAEQVERVRAAFSEAGRIDPPMIMKIGGFALGPRAQESATAYFEGYYGSRGSERLARAMQGVFIGHEAIEQAVSHFEAGGCQEMILAPTDADPEQVDRLAEVLHLR